MIPTLTTDRLTLRPYALADFDRYADLVGSEATRHMGGPHDRDTAWNWFCHDTASWHLHGHGSLAVTDSATGEVLGYVGIHHPPGFPEAEMGWVFHPEARGRGVATEAGAALKAHVLDTAPPASLVSYIDPANAPSLRLAARLGAVRDDAAPTPNGDPTTVWRHPLPETPR